jgi:sirohydrochlorin ferrochelatase
MGRLPSHVGIILVDHGSRFGGANALLEEVARLYQRTFGAAIVEPAHMELAEPTIAQAFGKCVARGAREIVVHPYFLSPGRHSSEDIPRITGEAAAQSPGVPYRLTEALGLDERMAEVIHRRVLEALERGDDT